MEKQNKENEKPYYLENLLGIDYIVMMEENRKKTEDDVCMHTPDLLHFITWDSSNDKIVHIYKCNCGKTIEEIFTHCDTKVI